MGLWEIIKGEQPGIIKTLLNYENAGQFGEFSTEAAAKRPADALRSNGRMDGIVKTVPMAEPGRIDGA